MYKHLIATAFFAFAATATQAQNVAADTLKAFKTAQKAQKLLKSGNEKKTAKAIELFKQAGSQGLPSACRFLAEHYRTTTPPDTTQSIHWLEILGDLGDTQSIDRLVDIYSGKLADQGYYADKNPQKLEEWSKTLANKGELKGIEAYANCFLQKGDTTQAIGWLEKAVEKESLPALKELANIYAAPGSNQAPERAFDFATKAAEKGDKDCMYLLGNMYRAGFGCQKDLNKAIETLEKCPDTQDAKLVLAACKMEINDGKIDENTFPVFLEAAQNGNAIAQYYIAHAYYDGSGVQADKQKAMEWMLKSAEQDHPYAQYACGMYYLTGQEPVQQDTIKGIEWLQKAANAGMPEAQADLAACYLEGRYVEKNEGKGVELLKMAAAQGNPNAVGILANYYIGQCEAEEDHQNGVLLLQSLATAGDVESQYNLGTCYLNQIGTKGLSQEQKVSNDDLKKLADGKELTDQQIGTYWMEKAADAGHPMAQQNMGLLIINDIIPGDKTKGIEWIRKSSDAGLPQSQYTLGVLTLMGQAGIKANPKAGLELLQKAANAGFPQAQNDLGMIFLQGAYGIKPNLAQGFSWMKKAATVGMPSSMFYTAVCYATGQGTAANKAEARKWMQKAAAQNDDPQVKQAAQEALKQM